ncbi:hypothetical protein BC828DRAFT_407922 [Blastocladiella britannica]|nr:hypothetical protein BC828DRAFT_407922 [Blastocladiella britannica]
MEEDTAPPVLLSADLLAQLTDVHCHLTDSPESLGLVGSPSVATGTMALMGTRLDDWSAVLATRTAHPTRVLGGFGIHPWYAPRTLASESSAGAPVTEHAWYTQLEALLIAHPWAFVGEIGMDKAAIDPNTKAVYDWDQQLTVFDAQWVLAIKYRRPVSMHVVHAQGWILRFMRDQSALCKTVPKCEWDALWPPQIMIHSFNGSHDLIKQLSDLKGIGRKLYFSFSTAINGRSPKFAERIRAVPRDRVLMESDTHTADRVDAAMSEVLTFAASALELSVEETAALTADNSARMYSL